MPSGAEPSSHPIDVGAASRLPGDPWPEEPPLELQRRQHSRQARPVFAPPLLSLGLGPFSVPLIPRRQSQNQRDVHELASAAAAALEPPAGLGAALAPRPCPAVAQLQAALAQQHPGLAQQLASLGEEVDVPCLTRWIKARGGCVEAAAAGLAAHAAWRAAFLAQARRSVVAGPADGPSEITGGASDTSLSSDAVPAGQGIPEGSIVAELAARKAFLQGVDSHGCPVVVVQAARHDMGLRDMAQTKRLIVYVLDTACATACTARNPAGQICCLFDLSGLRPRNLDAKALLAIFEMLQNHYPERLNALYFLNAPLLFWGVWRVVAPFLHAATRRKIRFAAGAAGTRELLQRVPAEVLPAAFGGSAELVPIETAAARWRHHQQQDAEAAAAAAVESHAGAEGGGGGAMAALAGAAAATRRQAGSAAHAAHRLVHGKLIRPVGGAAARAVHALRRHHRSRAPPAELSEQQQRSLLAQVVLTHVLLVGLLLRMLQRVLGRPARRQQGSAGKTPAASLLPSAAEDDAAGNSDNQQQQEEASREELATAVSAEGPEA